MYYQYYFALFQMHAKSISISLNSFTSSYITVHLLTTASSIFPHFRLITIIRAYRYHGSRPDTHTYRVLRLELRDRVCDGWKGRVFQSQILYGVQAHRPYSLHTTALMLDTALEPVNSVIQIVKVTGRRMVGRRRKVHNC